MYERDELIDGEYTVAGVCSKAGGMGTLLFVTPRTRTFAVPKLVLKYCRESDPEHIRRFRRETRLLLDFTGNSKVAQILDHNLDHDPPYYVMPFYAEGDLTTLHSSLAVDELSQERLFLQMIDCVLELHAKNVFHRDIKPQNFLRDGTTIRVSDLGLSMEHDSATAFTQSSQVYGTYGYLPPEYVAGGFKAPDAAGDIFMLGKSFYSLLTQRHPLHLVGNGIPDSLFHLIRKCCDPDRSRRYQTLSELKQAVVAVYDVLLRRVDGVVRAKQLLTTISTRLAQQHDYSVGEIEQLIDLFACLPPNESKSLAREIPAEFYELLTFAEFAKHVSDFLAFYRPMVESEDYGWSYAETIARNMRTLFDSPRICDTDKATALDLAIYSARAMNRFAAMETCQKMIKAVDSDALAFLVCEILRRYNAAFIASIEPVNCKHDLIATTIREMNGGLPEA